MSTFGAEFYDRKGGLIYASSEVTWNQVDSFIVNGGTGVFKDYPKLSGKELMVVQSMINAPPVDRRAIAHTVTINGTAVSITGGSETTLILVLMR